MKETKVKHESKTLTLEEIETIVKQRIDLNKNQKRHADIEFQVKYFDDPTRFGKMIQIADRSAPRTPGPITSGQWTSRFFPENLIDFTSTDDWQNKQDREFIERCICNDVDALQKAVWIQRASESTLYDELFLSYSKKEKGGFAHRVFEIPVGEERNIKLLKKQLDAHEEGYYNPFLKRYIELLEKNDK
jgi:hypothetical protein